MEILRDMRFRRYLSIALLALLLGAQSAQVGHFHADTLATEDCLQCSVDFGQALKSSIAQGPVSHEPGLDVYLVILPAASSTQYRLAPRGPPSHSC